MAISVFRSLTELRAGLREVRQTGNNLGFVPTMGALHDGHIRLGQVAKESGGKVIYSIFVNPMQFAPHEDFSRYPRTLDADIEKLEAAGIEMLYLPDPEEMYPENFSTVVHVDEITAPLEGEFRPAFFDGVATVVTKLLLHVQPARAYFGEKDYQQLQVVKRLSQNLDLPAEIIGVPTLRDANGLALSSRNAYLTPAQYEVACYLNRVLIAIGELARQGQELSKVEEIGTQALLGAGFEKVDYCTVRHTHTLQAAYPGEPLRAFVAAWIGKTRLIDNMAV